MGPHTPTIDDAYRRYVDLLLRHYHLLSERGDEDAEIEAVEEEMTRLWDHLDPVQRRSLSGLGSDLNWVRRGCQPAPRSGPLCDAMSQDPRAIYEAIERDDWHRALHELRVCSLLKTPASVPARLRGMAWRAIGFPQLAGLFFDLASKLEPSNGSIAYAALQTASEVDPNAALQRARTLLKDPSRHPVAAVALAVMILLEAKPECEREIGPSEATELLRGCLERLSLEPPSGTGWPASVYNLVAAGFRILGNSPEAHRAYEEGLRVDSNDPALLAGLGLLLYGRDDRVAVDLFTRAVELQSPFVQPYLMLAHYHISRHHFDEGLKHCAQALARTTSDKLRAELLEWAAICASELTFPDEAVRALFREARALDPTNERISKNQHAFEVGRRGPTGRPYVFEPADSFRVPREAEIRTALAHPAA